MVSKTDNRFPIAGCLFGCLFCLYFTLYFVILGAAKDLQFSNMPMPFVLYLSPFVLASFILRPLSLYPLSNEGVPCGPGYRLILPGP